MKTNAMLLAILLFGMSLAGCVSQSDGVAEVTLTDEQVDSIVDEHLDDFLSNVSITVNEEITNQNNTYIDSNFLPIIRASVGTTAYYEGADCTTVGISAEVRHAMTDWYGPILHAGWDYNLDGIIDHSVSADEGYSTLRIPLNHWLNLSTPKVEPVGPWGSTGGPEFENSIIFGASNVDGIFSSSEIFVLSHSGDIDTEPCRDFSSIEGYNFTYVDHPDDVSNGNNDYLVNVTRTNGQAGIYWDNVRFEFLGNQGDNWRTCWTLSRCEAIQTGSDDLFWEPGETIILKEVDNEGGYVHGESTSAAATIRIGVLFEGEWEWTTHVLAVN